MQVCKVEENLLQDCKFIVYRSPGEKQEIVRIMLETSVFEKDIVPRVSFVVVQHISTLYQVICYSISNLICITCQGRVKSIPSLLKHNIFGIGVARRILRLKMLWITDISMVINKIYSLQQHLEDANSPAWGRSPSVILFACFIGVSKLVPHSPNQVMGNTPYSLGGGRNCERISTQTM